MALAFSGLVMLPTLNVGQPFDSACVFLAVPRWVSHPLNTLIIPRSVEFVKLQSIIQ